MEPWRQIGNRQNTRKPSATQNKCLKAPVIKLLSNRKKKPRKAA
jgi:hypothetical protein